MKNIFKRHTKKIIISLPLFFVGLLIYSLLWNREALVSIGFRAFTQGDLKIEKLEFQKGSTLEKGIIELSNSNLIDMEGKIAGKIPKATVSYDNYQITSIDIYEPEVNFIRNKKYLNIVDIFVKNKKTENEKEEEVIVEETKNEELKNPILKKINVYNSNLLYEDLSYTNKISKNAKNVNGSIEFFDGYKLQLEFSGVGTKDSKEKLGISYDSYEQERVFSLNMKNINFNDNLLQYGYDSKNQIVDVEGKVDLELSFIAGDYEGYATLSNGKARYLDLDEDINDVNLKVDFLEDEIKINGDYLVGKNNGEFKLDYSKIDGVNVGFLFENISYEDANKYKYLKNLNLNLKNTNLNTADIWLRYKDKFRADIYFTSKDGIQEEKFKLKDIKGKFSYSDKEIRLENTRATLDLSTEESTTEVDIDNNLTYKNGKGKYAIEILKDNREILENYKLDFYFERDEEDNFKLKLDSKLISVEGYYNKVDKTLDINQGENFKGKYNFSNKTIERFSGNLISKIKDYTINFDTEIDKTNHQKINLYGKISTDKENKGKIDFNFDVDSFHYTSEFDIRNLEIEEKGISFTGDLSGKIKRDSRLSGQINIKNNQIKNLDGNIQIQDMNGILKISSETIKKEEKVSGNFLGRIENIYIHDVKIPKVTTNIKITEDFIEGYEIKNQNIDLNFKYFLNSLDFLGEVNLKNINEEILKIEDIKYNISSIQGNLKGKLTKELNQLEGSILVKEGNVALDEKNNVDFYGKINYNNGTVFSEKFNINKNKLNFKYLLKDKTGDYNLTLDENIFIKDYPVLNRGNFKGSTSGKIKDSNITGDFILELEGIALVDRELPKINFRGNYTNEIINFKDISYEQGKYLNAKGYIDIKNKFIDIQSENSKISINKFLEDKNYQGEFWIDGYITGKFDDIKYGIYSPKGNVYYKEDNIGRMTFKMSGNQKDIYLEYFTIEHLENYLYSEGGYNFAEKTPNFELRSSFQRIGILSEVAQKYKIDDLKGGGNFDIEYQDKKLKGLIDLNGFSLKNESLGIDLKDSYGEIAFDKNKIQIDNLSGILNEGKIKIDGKLELNEKITYPLFTNLERIRYDLSLEANKVNYTYKDFGKINFSTNLNLKNRLLSGRVILNEGIVKKIKVEETEDISDIKAYLEKKSLQEALNLMDLANLNEKIRTNIDIRIGEGIVLDIKEAQGNIKNIKGIVLGQGFLKGSLENLNFLGEVNIKEGEFSYGNQDFLVETGEMIFKNSEDRFPYLNPEILLSTNTEVNSKDYEITLRGLINNLEIFVRSGNEVGYSKLNSILRGDELSSETAVFIADLIGGQISDTVISPVVSLLQNYLGLSRIKFTSNIISQRMEKFGDDSLEYGIGGYVEASTPIYKDRIYGKVRFNFLNDESTTRRGKDYSIVEQEIGIYERINNNFSWGVGVQEIRETRKEKDKSKNYYMEIEFEKAFDFVY